MNPITRRLVRRSLVGFGLLVVIVTLSAFWPSIPDVDKGASLVATMPPPSHVEWTSYPVGGLFLARPIEGDTTRVELLAIPQGSVLSVPHLVPGADPDSLKGKS